MTNLKLLVLWENSTNEIKNSSIEKDRIKLKNYSIQDPLYDIEYEEIEINSIESYEDIVSRCEKKTRIIIWYTGSKLKKHKESIQIKDGKIIEASILMQHLSKHNILNVIVFDYCKDFVKDNFSPLNVTLKIENNISNLFDFKGKMIIIAKRVSSTSEESTFLMNFIDNFDTTYQNTIHLIATYFNIGIKRYFKVSYEKYLKDEESMLKKIK